MKKAALALTAALFCLAPLAAHAAEPVSVNPTTAVPTAPAAATAPIFTDAQRAEVENIIKSYLLEKNPELLPQVVKVLQAREQADNDSKTKAALTKLKDRIYNDAATPTGGNPKGNVTIVEFFDYQCGYCKLAEDGIENLLATDKNVKIIYKNYPILGQASVEAAKASLASVRQGQAKFATFHANLMKKKDRMSSDLIMQVAKDSGLDVEKLKKDMEDKAVQEAIDNGLKLGQEMGVHGTPMFIIGEDIFPGALQEEQLKQAVATARGKAKK